MPHTCAIYVIMMFRGTKTSVNIDNMEERKVHDHFNLVTSKLEKLHKSLMWNMFIGRSFLDKVRPNAFKSDLQLHSFLCKLDFPLTIPFLCLKFAIEFSFLDGAIKQSYSR